MLGDKTRRAVSNKAMADAVSLPKLEKTVHLSIHATGDGVDKIDWLDIFESYNEAETPFEITSANCNVYYTTPKEKKKENDRSTDKNT